MKSAMTLTGEALVAAADNRDRALQNLRNAVATSEEDASLDRDAMIADAVAGFTAADQALAARSMNALALAPPRYEGGGEVLAGPGAPGTEEPLPETPTPGDPTPTQDDPSVPKRDKVPPAQPVQPDPSGNAVVGGPDPRAAEAAAAKAKGTAPRAVKDMPQA